MRSRVPQLSILFGILLLGTDALAADKVFTPSTTSTVFKAVNQTIVANTAIDVAQFGAISSLAVSGRATLSTDKGFVRVVLVSTRGEEYLVLETNSLLAKGKQLELDEYCEETKKLAGVTASHLNIEIKDALLTLTSVSTAPAGASRARAAAAANGMTEEERDAQRAEKVLAVRFSTKQKGLHWVAGDTPMARKSYAEKKALFGGRLPNLNGFEYYVGGIFEIPRSAGATSSGSGVQTAAAAGASAYVSDFSWRNKDGQNWLTGVRDQGGCGSCWAFAATGATELLTNIYFNRHVDLDLSEQDALSCMGSGSCAGGNPTGVLDYITQNGMFEEGCFPYTATDQACSSQCGSPVENVKIGGRVAFNNDSEDTLKSMILTSAVSMGIVDWWHALTLAGYRTLKVGDSFFVRDYNQGTQWITITAADTNLIGKTVWEFKNSWGPLWGDNGYVYVLTDLGNIYLTDQLLPPVTRRGHSNSEIACTDVDGDGYYAWGIGAKPASCPAASRAEQDGDDSNNCKGPRDPYGNVSDFCGNVTPNFIASNQSACLADPTTFTDLSTGQVTAWSWSFGAGASPATATGKGPWSVTYATTGAKTVSLTVTGPTGKTATTTRVGYVNVPSVCNPYKLEVYARNEAYTQTNETKPRIYLANMGTLPVGDFKVVYKFTTNGKTPKLEDWYTPYDAATLTKVSGNTYKVVHDFVGYSLSPGQIVPDTLGDSVGLHYTDWSTWTVTTKFKPGASFALNTDLGVYDKNGALIYGTAQ